MHQPSSAGTTSAPGPTTPATGVPEAVAPPPGHPRFPLIDALRALAAIAILVVHVAIFSHVFEGAFYRRLVAHLDIGVTLFFLLSGFLLYRPMLAARVLGAPRSRVRDYARRRVLRIAPAYWLALTVLAIFPGLYGVFSGNWWVYYGLLQNYPVFTIDHGCAVNGFRCGIGPSWSLAIEVVFYAVLPLFAFAMARATRRLRGGRWLAAELGVLAAISAVSVLIQSLTIHYSAWWFFSPLGRGWWFGLGMALAAVSVWIQQRGRAPGAVRWAGGHPGAMWTAAALLYVVPSLLVFHPGPMAGFPLGSSTQYTAQYILFGLIGALLLVPAVFGDGAVGWPRRLLAHPALAWLGLVSYGIFLWHFPILVALGEAGVAGWWPAMAFPVLGICTFAITVACAALSYYLVERPLMRLKYGRRRGPGPMLAPPTDDMLRPLGTGSP
jgi:peptidoglycan/LPS O-acetylase OafA/YrhL